jgi:hypothetical protein
MQQLVIGRRQARFEPPDYRVVVSTGVDQLHQRVEPAGRQPSRSGGIISQQGVRLPFIVVHLIRRTWHERPRRCTHTRHPVAQHCRSSQGIPATG